MVKCERSYPIDDDLGRNTIAYRVALVELGRDGMRFGGTYPVEMHFLSTIQYRVARASLVRRRRRADLPWSLARHTKVYRVGRAGGPTLEHNFAGNVLAHQNPLDHIGDPSGPGGYMRKASGEHTQNVSASPSALYPKDINLYRVCDLEISRALSHGGTISGHSLTFEG